MKYIINTVHTVHTDRQIHAVFFHHQHHDMNDDVHTHTHKHGDTQSSSSFTELTVNAITIDPTLESGRIDTLCFLLTAMPRCSAPCCCEKASEAAFRPRVRLLKSKQTAPEGPVHCLCAKRGTKAL